MRTGEYRFPVIKGSSKVLRDSEKEHTYSEVQETGLRSHMSEVSELEGKPRSHGPHFWSLHLRWMTTSESL